MRGIEGRLATKLPWDKKPLLNAYDQRSSGIPSRVRKVSHSDVQCRPLTEQATTLPTVLVKSLPPGATMSI